MAAAVLVMYVDLGAPMLPFVFASDAMVADATDNGGSTVVGAEGTRWKSVGEVVLPQRWR